MKKAIVCLIAFFAYYLYSSCYGQNVHFSFDNITANDGLAGRNINAITQDAVGFIWAGSEAGLTRYNGYSCLVYRHESGNAKSLSDNEIYALCTDGNGELWIGTRNGLNRYNAQNDRFETFLHDSSDDHSISGNEIFALAKDAAGDLWIGTFGGGLDKMIKTKKGCQFIHYKHDDSDSNSISSNQIFSICFDKRGQAWIGTFKGLNVMQPTTKKFIHIYHQPENINSISNNIVNRIFIDDNNAIWISGRGMLDKISCRGSLELYSYSVQHLLPAISGKKKLSDWVVNYFITDRNGNAWIGTHDDGLFKVAITWKGEFNSYEHFVSSQQISYSLVSSSIYCLYEDRSGIIWIGTPKGISKYIPLKAKFNELNYWHKAFSVDKQFIRALLSDNSNRLWFSYNSDTLCIVDKAINNEQVISLPVSKNGLDQINVLYQSIAGDIYIGTLLQGLFILPKSMHNIHDKKNWISITADQYPGLLSNNIYSITEDNEGMIWVGSFKGLSCYNPTNRLMRSVYGLPDEAVASDYIMRSICADSKGIIWCGTDDGVYLINGDGVIKTFKNVEKDSTSLSHNGVTFCYIDHEKNVWIGTKEGLNLYNPRHNNFQRLSIKNGLSNDAIRSLQEDTEGNLWIGTNHGLTEYNPKEKKFYTYTIEDGLVSDQFNRNAACSDSTGIFYFGTNEGIVSFRPKNIVPNVYAPPILITNIKLFNTPISALYDTTLMNTYKRENKLLLKHNQNFFSFEFAALNYINSAANQYAYKLEGVDKQWNYVGTQRFAGYTDIAPGDYVFKVKAANNDGIWNNVPVTLTVTIVPPWWQTWWFYSVCAIIVCAIIYLIYHIRLQQIIKVYKLRTSIASDLHDDVGSALSSIALLSNIAQDGKTNTLLKPEEIFSRIGDTSKRMIDLMDDIVWTVNPANDKFGNMLIRMREYAVEMFEAKNISFIFKISEDIEDLKIPMHMRKHYFLVFKEAVNNLVKYSSCSNAAILIDRVNRDLVTTIKDDGKGFDPKIICSGNGLKNMPERANALKGRLNIETAPGEGTCVTLVIPVT